ncbi:hypothetical protein Ancab_032410 [Ancistrocladus abbreviatus]
MKSNEDLKPSPLVGQALGTLEKAISAVNDVNEVSPRAEASASRNLARKDHGIFLETTSFSRSPKARVIRRPSQGCMNIISTHNLRLNCRV